MTRLRNLSKHVYHGRIWIREVDASTAMCMVPESDECLMWHDWYPNSDTLYEISISATSWGLCSTTLHAIKKKFPMAHVFIASNGTLTTNPQDWMTIGD